MCMYKQIWKSIIAPFSPLCPNHVCNILPTLGLLINVISWKRFKLQRFMKGCSCMPGKYKCFLESQSIASLRSVLCFFFFFNELMSFFILICFAAGSVPRSDSSAQEGAEGIQWDLSLWFMVCWRYHMQCTLDCNSALLLPDCLSLIRLPRCWKQCSCLARNLSAPLCWTWDFRGEEVGWVGALISLKCEGLWFFFGVSFQVD